MGFNWGLLAMAIILMAFSALALELSNTPKSITFFENTKEIRFEVLNNSDFEQPLKIEFFSPINYRIANRIPSTLLPAERTEVILQLFPSEKVLHTDYTGTLLVSLGEETEQKEIKMFFEQNQETQTNQQEFAEAKTPTGFASIPDYTSSSFWINFVLIIVAAVLLISFISRMNQRAK